MARSYRNPIIGGFHPDPSICRVGEDYYLASSTFEWFPGVPIHHSRDLTHWRLIGHCLTRPEQLPLDGAASSSGIWAPTLRCHGGRFYMITTNMHWGWNFIVCSDTPAGPWSAPVRIDEHGIDPSLLFDDDGRVYYTRTGEGDIRQCELDVATGKKRTEMRVLWAGTGGSHPEGPHLYHIGRWYYLMIAEGGTGQGHAITIARSESPWGPFEPCPHNPILTHRHLSNLPIQALGHGDLVEDPAGRWWMVCLGHRWVQQAHHLGRETFLAPVEWTDAGWPVVNAGRPIGLEMAAELPPEHPWPAPAARTVFDGPELPPEFCRLRNPHPGDVSLTDPPGRLSLRASTVALDDLDSPALVARRQQHLRCRAAARVTFDPAEGEQAGLTLFMRERYHYDLALTRQGGRRQVVLRKTVGDMELQAGAMDVPDGPVVLELRAEPEAVGFYAGCGDGPLEPIGSGLTKFIGSEMAGGFTGVFLGLYAIGHGNNRAEFDWFDYEPTE